MKFVVLFLSILIYSGTSAQEINFTQPINSDYLTKYGISIKTLNAAVNPMYQEDVRMHANLRYKIKEGKKKVFEGTIEADYTPFYHYGLKLNWIVKDEAIYDEISKRALKRDIEKLSRAYRLIREENLVQPKDIGLIRESETEVVLGFQYDKSKLPKGYKHLAKFMGSIHVVNGKLSHIDLNMIKPMKVQGAKLDRSLLKVEFIQLDEGGYLVSRMHELRSGTKNGANYLYENELVVASYDTKDGKKLLDKTEILGKASDPNKLDTVAIRLERHLPVLGNAARKAGYELPLPFGVDLFTHFQTEVLGLEKIILNGEDLTQTILARSGSNAEAYTNLVAGRGDVWILPFLNFSLMAGYMSGTTDITLNLSDDVKQTLGLLGYSESSIKISTEVKGPVLGGGLTLAGGYKNFFGTVNAMYINQRVEAVNTTVEAIAITPMVGARFPKFINIMVGGQYQIYNTDITGKIPLSTETLDFEVKLRATRWNWLFGLQRDFSNAFNGTIMIGGEPRPQATVVLGYRF